MCRSPFMFMTWQAIRLIKKFFWLENCIKCISCGWKIPSTQQKLKQQWETFTSSLNMQRAEKLHILCRWNIGCNKNKKLFLVFNHEMIVSMPRTIVDKKWERFRVVHFVEYQILCIIESICYFSGKKNVVEKRKRRQLLQPQQRLL